MQTSVAINNKTLGNDFTRRYLTGMLGIITLVFAFLALLAPLAAQASMIFPANIIAASYPSSQLRLMCANCHTDFAGSSNGNAMRWNWNLYRTADAFPTPNTHQFFMEDPDNDGTSTGQEYINSNNTPPANTRWFPAIPDKDNDGCLMLINRVHEQGVLEVPLNPSNVVTSGSTSSGEGFFSVMPRGWDMDDNNATPNPTLPTGCSTAWPASTTAGTFNNPGTSPDIWAPGQITDFRANGPLAGAIPLVWKPVGDDAVGSGGPETTVAAHSYDIKYTTGTGLPLLCGGGATQCQVRDPAHWAQMYSFPDGQVKDVGWNKANPGVPLMRALFEPVPDAPSATSQGCTALGYTCTASPGASYILQTKGVLPNTNSVQVNVITDNTLYWLANRVADGVVRLNSGVTLVTATPANMSDQGTISNIIGVTAGGPGTGVALTSNDNATIAPNSTVTVTAQGYGLTSANAARLVLVNTSGTPVLEATAVNPLTTSVSGTFNTTGLATGPYTLEVRPALPSTVTKAARVNAINVEAAAPTISTLDIIAGGQGATRSIGINGSNFSNTGLSSSFGPGIIVNSTTYNSSTKVTANISIAPNATTGLRDVTVNTGGQSATKTGAFTVTQAPTHSCTTLPNGSYGQPYTPICTGSLGVTPYTWTVTGLPASLAQSVSADTLTLSFTGVPTVTGLPLTYPVSIKIEDANLGTITLIPNLTIDPVAPSAPASVVATAGNAQVALNVGAPTSSGGATVVYDATCTPVPPATGTTGSISGATTTSFTVTGLTNMISPDAYTCSVTARNSAGSSSAVVSNSFTPSSGNRVPDPPTGVTAVRGNTSATVSYAAPLDDGGLPIDRYTATCTSSTGGVTGSNFTPSGTVAPILVSGLTNGATYTCTVKARNSLGESAASAASAIFKPATVPGAPTSVTAVAGNGKGTVSFTAPASDGGEAIIDYTANCTSSDGGAAGTLTAAGSPITVSGLTNGKTYTCAVTARNAVGSGAAGISNSFIPQATAPDSAPTITSVTPGGGSCTVSYSPPLTDGGSPITGYTATCTSGTGVTGTVPDDAASPTTVTGLTVDAPYTCVVAAKNIIGTGPDSSPSATCVPTVVDTTPPIPSLTPAAGTYYAPQTVAVDVTKDGTIYYTLDGTAPTISSTACPATTTAPCMIAINSSKLLKLIACNSSGACSPTTLAAYNIVMADLVLTPAVSTASGSVAAGANFSISSTVLNQGSTPSTAMTATKFYLSPNAIIGDADDILLTGTGSVASGLAAGGSKSNTTTVTVPRTTEPQVYYIGAMADGNNAQAEYNALGTAESNNTSLGNQITVTRDVDLIMSAVSTASTQVGAGHRFSILNAEQNVGSTKMTAASNQVKFYLSQDAVITTSDILIGSRSVSALAAGATNTATTLVKVPKTVQPGIYTYGAIADATNVQPENGLNENNNATAGGTITVIRKVDLVMSLVSTAASSVGAGHSFLVTSTETNQGSTDATVSNMVKFYLSSDSGTPGCYTTADNIQLTGSRSVSSSPLTASGGSSTGSKTVTVPKTTTPGLGYTLCAVADANGAQPEENLDGSSADGNNALAATGTFEVRRDVDLLITSVGTAAASVTAGSSFTIDVTERNNGTTNMTVSSNQIKFYLVAEAGGAETALSKTLSISSIPAQSSKSGSKLVTVPASLASFPGTYRIRAVADFLNSQIEEAGAGEGNNSNLPTNLSTGTITIN